MNSQVVYQSSCDPRIQLSIISFVSSTKTTSNSNFPNYQFSAQFYFDCFVMNDVSRIVIDLIIKNDKSQSKRRLQVVRFLICFCRFLYAISNYNFLFSGRQILNKSLYPPLARAGSIEYQLKLINMYTFKCLIFRLFFFLFCSDPIPFQ